jgi:hypothetical protein
MPTRCEANTGCCRAAKIINTPRGWRHVSEKSLRGTLSEVVKLRSDGSSFPISTIEERLDYSIAMLKCSPGVLWNTTETALS